MKIFIKKIYQVGLIKFVPTLIIYIYYEVYSIKLFYFILKLSLNLSKILIFFNIVLNFYNIFIDLKFNNHDFYNKFCIIVSIKLIL